MSAGIKVAVQVRMEVAAIPVYHNGTELRDSLPLWNGAARRISSERFLERVAAIPVCHTGTKSRDLLPLWKRAARGIGLDRSLEGPYYGFR